MPSKTMVLLSLITRHLYPFRSGIGTLVQLPPIKWCRFREDLLAVRLARGVTVLVPPNDHIGRAVYFFGAVDHKIIRALNGILRDGDTVVDIGANYGTVALPCADRVGQKGRVIAIDPQGQCCKAILEAAMLNGFTNIEVHQIALSCQGGRVHLYSSDLSNSGMVTMSAVPNSAPIAEVQAVLGSTFLRQCEIAGDYVVKIDVEGHEQEVLLGLEAYFLEHPPRGIVFEVTGSEFAAEKIFKHQGIQLLRRLGYEVRAIRKALVGPLFEPLSAKGPSSRCTDFIATRPA